MDCLVFESIIGLIGWIKWFWFVTYVICAQLICAWVNSFFVNSGIPLAFNQCWGWNNGKLRKWLVERIAIWSIWIIVVSFLFSFTFSATIIWFFFPINCLLPIAVNSPENTHTRLETDKNVLLIVKSTHRKTTHNHIFESHTTSFHHKPNNTNKRTTRRKLRKPHK